MRRIAFIAALLLSTGAGLLVANAGADDSHTYEIELDNAFGLVHGSEVRIAGVTAGTVQSLDINAAKRAVVTVNVTGPLAQLRVDATCASQPQSLIAEYFLDCQPGRSHKLLPDGGQVPVSQTRTTVQNDLVNATLREPFKERFALLINEFGTALAGNPQNLNAAIRRGAPALQALRKALAILANQNRVIRDLNVNSDQIISRLAARRNDVVRFVQNANQTATASAQRGTDLSRNFHLLPGFLAELRPTLARLGDLSQASTPVLAQLNAASGQLAKRSDAQGAIFLNDVAVDTEGTVYVSDTPTNTIWRLKDGSFAPWLANDALNGPNGLLVQGDKLIVASLGKIQSQGQKQELAGLLAISLVDQSVSKIGKGDPIGNLDGLEVLQPGVYLVTDWAAGALYRVDAKGKVERLIDLNQGSADLTYLPDKKMVLIPMMLDNTLVAYKLD